MTTRPPEPLAAARDQLRKASAPMPAWVRLDLLDATLRGLRQVAAAWAQDRGRMAKASGVSQAAELDESIRRLAAIRERHIIRAMAAGDDSVLRKVSDNERARLVSRLARLATTGDLAKIVGPSRAGDLRGLATTGDLRKSTLRH